MHKKYTRKQLEQMSIEELKQIDIHLTSNQVDVKPITDIRSSACDPINGIWEAPGGFGGSCDSECTAAGFVKGNPTYWDQNIDILDIIEVRNFILNPAPFSNHDMPPFYNYWPCIIWAMDINNDRDVNVIDIQYFIDLLLAGGTEGGGNVPEELKVLQINAGHLFNINYTDVYNSSDDFPECLPGCTQQGLCRRSDEDELRDFISNHQPDIVTITELISNQECIDNAICQEAADLSMDSSCRLAQYSDEQIRRVLPNNYTYSCSDPLYTCIAVKNSVGSLGSDSITTDLPEQCNGLDSWPINVNYNYVTLNNGSRIKVIAAHPLNASTQHKDKCRKAHYQQIFDDLYNPNENILIAGDFNTDPYRWNWSSIFNWNELTNQEWTETFAKTLLNEFNPIPNVMDYTTDGVCPIGEDQVYHINSWDIDVNLSDVEFSITNPAGQEVIFGQLNNANAEYYDLNFILRLDDTSQKICMDMTAWHACPEFPIGQGCGGWFNNHLVWRWSGDIVMTIRMYQPETDEDGIVIPAPAVLHDVDASGLDLNSSGWIVGAEWMEERVKNSVAGKIEDMIMDYESIGDLIVRLSPVDYDSIVQPVEYNYIDSAQYWHSQTTYGDKGFTVHNVPQDWNLSQSPYANDWDGTNYFYGPDITHSFMFLEGTLDYIISNFSNSRNCQTYEFDFMDHHALMCQLHPAGDVNMSMGVDVGVEPIISNYSKNKLVVKYKSRPSSQKVNQQRSKHNLNKIEYSTQVPQLMPRTSKWVEVEFQGDVELMKRKLEQDPDVEMVEYYQKEVTDYHRQNHYPGSDSWCDTDEDCPPEELPNGTIIHYHCQENLCAVLQIDAPDVPVPEGYPIDWADISYNYTGYHDYDESLIPGDWDYIDPNPDDHIPPPELGPIENPMFNDTMYLDQLETASGLTLRNIRFNETIETFGYGNYDVTVAVHDAASHPDINHPDIEGNVITLPYDVEGLSNSLDYNENLVGPPTIDHSAKVAGIISATPNNNLGIVGLCPKCTSIITSVSPLFNLPNPVTGNDSWGNGSIPGIIQNNNMENPPYGLIKVVNMSIGLGVIPQNFSQYWQDSINDAVENDILIIASAGNNGTLVDYGNVYLYGQHYPDRSHFPCAYDGVMCVAGDYPGSNYGTEQIDVTAPSDIYSTSDFGGYDTFGGTSAATPVVTALASYLLSHKPDLTRSELIECIEASQVHIPKYSPNGGGKSQVTDLHSYHGFTESEASCSSYQQMMGFYWTGFSTQGCCCTGTPEEPGDSGPTACVACEGGKNHPSCQGITGGLNCVSGARPNVIDFYSATEYLYENFLGGVPTVPYDVNQDGTFDIADIVYIVNHLLNDTVLTEEQFAAADFNGNGVVNITDVVNLVQQILQQGDITAQQSSMILNELNNLNNN